MKQIDWLISNLADSIRGWSWRLSIEPKIAFSFKFDHSLILYHNKYTKDDLPVSYAPGPGFASVSGLFLFDFPNVAEGDVFILDDFFQT
jgi:hypothetical protein